ncbi:PMCA-type calcium-translocating P-type ATPase, partial [Hyaloraphidium curvatum]
MGCFGGKKADGPVELADPDPAPFAFPPSQLAALFDPKSTDLLMAMGGGSGLCTGLLVDPNTGLDEAGQAGQAVTDAAHANGANGPTKGIPLDSVPHPTNSPPIPRRQEIYGVNRLPEQKSKSIFELMWLAAQDKTIILLSVAALVSLAFGLWQDFDPNINQNDEPKVHWVEGTAILIAVVVVILAGSINDWQKERQFRKLNAVKDDRTVVVLRGGNIKEISIFDVVVGDIMTLEPGDVLAVDGVLLTSSGNLKVDESAATGESDAIKKSPVPQGEKHWDPFILSGGKVQEGTGRFVVCAVGQRSYFGRTMMALRTEAEDTPLQVKLDKLAERIAKLGAAAAITMFLVLSIKYIITVVSFGGQGFGPDCVAQECAAEALQQFVQIIISAITIIVVAVPEGLPLAVTLSLAYGTIKMLKDNNLVRVLAACETMGGATTICSDKTGTLTQNKMTVVKGVVGMKIFIENEDQIKTLPSRMAELPQTTTSTLSIEPTEAAAPRPLAPTYLLSVLQQSVALNSSAFEGVDSKTGEKTLVGSKTETALLEFSVRVGGPDGDFNGLRAAPWLQTVQVFPFSSERKSMATVVKIDPAQRPQEKLAGGKQEPFYRVFVKGASEIVLSFCSWAAVVPAGNAAGAEALLERLNPKAMIRIQDIINVYASESLRTICLAYRDLTASEFDPEAFQELCMHGCTLLSIVGIEDPLRPGVAEAVERCKTAGVVVRMVTGDNIITAKAIASKCGIYQKGVGYAMEGAKFRTLSEEEMDRILPRLQVLARSSPTDKQLLVGRLKELGETVAVTGDGTNDGPALKMADVGFAMGIAGTEVAKEASSIILMDDNFASIVRAMMWGRAVNDSVKKFLQFQLTVNITAVTLAFVSAVADGNEQPVLTAVQLLWVNLIMDTLAALALATEEPTDEILDRPPQGKDSPLITLNMWKMIMSEAIFQITVALQSWSELLYGEKIQLKSIIFNTFVFMQMWNMINCRRIDSKLNIFSGIHRNKAFIIIFFFIIACQILIMFFGGAAFKVKSLTGPQWAVSVIVGLFSLPVGAVARLVPNDVFFFWLRCL